jgi:hypothetical protein
MSTVIEWMAAEAERPEGSIPPFGGRGSSGTADENPHFSPKAREVGHPQPGLSQTREMGHPDFSQVPDYRAAPEVKATPGVDSEVEQARRTYRGRTVGMLRRYMRYSMETGRLPSLLGREFFRAKVTQYTVVTFEDRVIFVHDMEICLERLDEFSRQIIARHILQEHDRWATAKLLHCNEKTVRRLTPLVLDKLSDILLEVGLMERVESNAKKSCQGGLEDETSVSDCEEGENKF